MQIPLNKENIQKCWSPPCTLSQARSSTSLQRKPWPQICRGIMSPRMHVCCQLRHTPLSCLTLALPKSPGMRRTKVAPRMWARVYFHRCQFGTEEKLRPNEWVKQYYVRIQSQGFTWVLSPWGQSKPPAKVTGSSVHSSSFETDLYTRSPRSQVVDPQ